MTIVNDEELLLKLANAIDEEQLVDWHSVEESASAPSRAIVGQLRILDGMARIARAPDLNLKTHTPRDPLPSSPDFSEQPARHWGPLAVFEPIGGGSFGTVYRARDSLSREVALKLFKDRADSSRLVHEGQLLGRVTHSNVIVVHGAGTFDGQAGLWMELVRGRTLEQELDVRGAFSAEEARLIGVDVARALAAVHEAGLIHRDVKAHNVMRAQGGRIILMDFGAGTEMATGPSAVDIAGTPAYLAPEVFAGRPASRQSDIYSVGVLLFHLASGSYPFRGSNRFEIQGAQNKGQIRRLRDLRPDLPESFVRVVERCLSVDPQQRYQTAGELEHALLASTGVEPLPSPAPRIGRKMTVFASTALVASLLVAWFLWTHGPANTQSPASQTASSAIEKPTQMADAAYTIKSTFLKIVNGRHVPVAPGDRVAPGDELGLTLQTSTDVYVYVVNEDDHGESFLLFPLPGQERANPLKGGEVHELPGTRGGAEVHWRVTSAGGQEHFVVYVSPTHLSVFDGALKSLPAATEARQITYARLSERVLTRLRGVGGLFSTSHGTRPSDAHYLFEGVDPMIATTDTAHGIWARQLTLANPGS